MKARIALLTALAILTAGSIFGCKVGPAPDSRIRYSVYQVQGTCTCKGNFADDDALKGVTNLLLVEFGHTASDGSIHTSKVTGVETPYQVAETIPHSSWAILLRVQPVDKSVQLLLVFEKNGLVWHSCLVKGDGSCAADL